MNSIEQQKQILLAKLKQLEQEQQETKMNHHETEASEGCYDPQAKMFAGAIGKPLTAGRNHNGYASAPAPMGELDQWFDQIHRTLEYSIELAQAISKQTTTVRFDGPQSNSATAPVKDNPAPVSMPISSRMREVWTKQQQLLEYLQELSNQIRL